MSSLPAAPPSALARFSQVIGGLIRAVVARSGSRVMTDAMIMLVSRRIIEISGLVQRLALAIQAGTLRTRRSPPPGCTRRPATRPALVLPRGHAWLLKLMTYDAAAYGLHLRAVLDDPEMAALLAASPRLVRTLKPLCRMLGVAMPVPPEPVPPPPTLPETTLPKTAPQGGARPAALGGEVVSRRIRRAAGRRVEGAVENRVGATAAFLRAIRYD